MESEKEETRRQKLKSGKRVFIDKKKWATYAVMHRSQQDGAHGKVEKASDRVLVPIKRMTDLGFPDDGYNYEQHVRPIEGGGVFVDKEGKTSRMSLPEEALAVEEVANREYDAVTLDPRFLDNELRSALFDDNIEDQFEELADNFIEEAAAPEENDSGAFDFEAHIANLIRLADNDLPSDEPAIHDKHDSTFDDEAFEAALEEYELSEEINDSGAIKFDDEFFDAMLDDASHTSDKESEANDEKLKRHIKARAEDILAKEEDEDIDAELDRALNEQAQKRIEREDAFDCESVLSTLSNLDNRPVLLDIPASTKKSVQKNCVNSSRTLPKLATLSEHAVLHAPHLDDDEHDSEDDDPCSTVTAPKSKKFEDSAHKKVRKAKVKEEKRLARARKKESKLAWAASKPHAAVSSGTGHQRGVSVFSLS